MSALLDSMAQAFCGSDARREVLDSVLRDGLPGARSETWKYTSLRQLERRSFAAAPLAPALLDAAALEDIPAPRLVFVNGRLNDALSDVQGLPAGVQLETLSSALAAGEDAVRFLGRRYERSDEVFARLNAALADEGVVLRVDDGVQVEVPLQLVFASVAGDTDLAWHHRHLIELRAGASLGVVEHRFSVGDSAHLDNTVLHAHVARDAVLKHARVQAGSARQTSFLRTDAVLAKDAQYHRVDLELGAALSRHELNVRLEGDNAQLTANGVAANRSRVVFHGGIQIRAGADGTDANLSNKNLLLSADAEIDTQPTLVIDADEVKAAHGATVGQLDANALFYLRSRGLPQAQAQALLSAAFCHEPLRVLPEALREQLARRLDKALAEAGVA
ncbi:SufB/SufD family protein [Stenotrophomonas indicatrix]|uniref:SufB/SufD family protein n=1 Tax=Stenotrophomonas indicatrix TaxID=2045451 RepID=UPI0028A26CA0|nr:SufD family Fe-S cluster assembly protein [Stenotrophomonas indicatrix]